MDLLRRAHGGWLRAVEPPLESIVSGDFKTGAHSESLSSIALAASMASSLVV